MGRGGAGRGPRSTWQSRIPAPAAPSDPNSESQIPRSRSAPPDRAGAPAMCRSGLWLLGMLWLQGECWPLGATQQGGPRL